MKGWKTWAGAALIAASAVLTFLGHGEIAGMIGTIGASFGLVGIAHKVEKTKGG